MSDQQQDTEIILGTGKLLAIFFGLVALCGTFFGLGYSLGHSSSPGPMTLQNGQTSTLANASVTKPAAGVTVTAAAPAPIAETPQPATTDPNTAATQPDQAPPAQDSSANSDASTSVPASTILKGGVTQVAARSNPASDPAATPATITVQVAAVTKEEDAQALVTALRRKNYPVFVPPNPSADSLYHVQVGPFAELKDAEAMKSKLAGDGYNAIVKK
jgi:cell division septation protein DedD